MERHAKVDQGVDGRGAVASPVALELAGRPQQAGKVAATVAVALDVRVILDIRGSTFHLKTN